MEYDYLIVGAGFAGLTFAERAAAAGRTSLVVERRGHIGGNSYDRYDDHGVLVHAYGPHYFRTNSPRIVDYLSQFTEWQPCSYTILSRTEGRYWRFPINLNTFEQFLGRASTTSEMEAWLAHHRLPIENPKNSAEVILSQVGQELYEKFFRGYTRKQWRRDPTELDPSVCGRIPIRTNRDDRYLKEDFQALPKAGYSRLFERMVAAGEGRIKILLHADYREVARQISYDHLVYTGPIDEYFGSCYGPLPYRSLRFEAESFTAEQLADRLPIAGQPGFWQPAMQVNYPNEEAFTRIVELKHATGQQCTNTTIVREYPADYGPGREPFYPVPTSDAANLYDRYRLRAEQENGVTFIGRLATYRYYNMDQVIGMALAAADRQLARTVRRAA